MKDYALFSTVFLVLVILLFASPAPAREYGPYFNVSIGNSEYDTDITNFGDSTSFSLGGGFALNRHFSIEANYLDFGDAEDNIFPVWTINANAFEVCAIGKLPVNPIFSFYGKLGFFSWDADVTEEGFGLIATDDGTDVTVGAGALIDLGQSALYLNYQNYDITLQGVDVSLDNYSFGFQLYF